MVILKKTAHRIARTKFARQAIDERADLGAIKHKPTARTFLGIFLMGCSYLLGWPLIALIGMLSIYWDEPLLAVIGVPVCFIVSHLVFVFGMYLAGGKYVMVFVRWATRIALEKLM